MTNEEIPKEELEAAASYELGYNATHFDSKMSKEGFNDALAVLLAKARAEERERCAQIAEGRHMVPTGVDEEGNVTDWMPTAQFPDDGRRIAAAIRQETP